MIHELKTIQPFFEEVWCNRKTFELRRNDRGFKVGDILKLFEYDIETNKYSGRYCFVEVISILENFPGIQSDYCIMSIRMKNK